MLCVARSVATQPSYGGGLTFTLPAKRTAAWVLRYRFGGKPRELTIGRYPDITLAKARELTVGGFHPSLRGWPRMDAKGGERRSATIHSGLNGCRAYSPTGRQPGVPLPRLARLQKQGKA